MYVVSGAQKITEFQLFADSIASADIHLARLIHPSALEQ